MASEKTNAASNLDTIVLMLEKQEKNMSKRLDMLENKIDNINREIIEKVKELDIRVSSVEKSADFIGQQFESQKKTTDFVLKSHTVLTKENEALKNEIKFLRSDQERQRNTLNDLEQYGRRDCLEISGVPPDESENTEDITIAIAKEIGVDVI